MWIWLSGNFAGLHFIDQRCHGIVLHFMDMVAIESYCIVWVWSLWNGIVLCGCGCHGMVLCGCGCHGMVLCGCGCHGMVLCGSEWYCVDVCVDVVVME